MDETAPPILDPMTDSEAIRSKLNAMLLAAVGDPAHPFHWPIFASLGVDGTPECRMMVLRDYDAERGEFFLHTDHRSAKMEDIDANELSSLYFYDASLRLQIRVAGITDVHHRNEVTRKHFAALPEHAKAMYGVRTPPGKEIDIDAPFDVPPTGPVNLDSAYQNFAVVRVTSASADVLELHPTGHRRIVISLDSVELDLFKRIAP